MAEAAHAEYGPLAGLIGTWTGDKGLDIAPEPDGLDETPYYETIVFEAAGYVQNAESQTLMIVRYHQIVRKKANDEVFHDQVGYWTWDAQTGVVAQSLTIPRAVCVLAGGEASTEAGGETTLIVRAKRGDNDWGVVQSPFMRDNASTESFEHTLSVAGDRLKYSETTVVAIYGRTFDHVDANELVRTQVS